VSVVAAKLVEFCLCFGSIACAWFDRGEGEIADWALERYLGANRPGRMAATALSKRGIQT
jgi:hypothetical protein